MHFAVVLMLLAQANQAAETWNRLTPEQVAQITALVKETEQRNIELQAQLRELQAMLTDAYATYELDIQQIRRLKREIAQTQEELLLNYHTLQVGFRKVVGPERFPHMKARIDYYLKTNEQRRKEQEQAAETAKIPPKSTAKPTE